MAVREAENEDDVVPVRQRKAHKKSRLGCKNCKLRSVKVRLTRTISNNHPNQRSLTQLISVR
jgi:hypothetical protein